MELIEKLNNLLDTRNEFMVFIRSMTFALDEDTASHLDNNIKFISFYEGGLIYKTNKVRCSFHCSFSNPEEVEELIKSKYLNDVLNSLNISKEFLNAVTLLNNAMQDIIQFCKFFKIMYENSPITDENSKQEFLKKILNYYHQKFDKYGKNINFNYIRNIFHDYYNKISKYLISHNSSGENTINFYGLVGVKNLDNIKKYFPNAEIMARGYSHVLYTLQEINRVIKYKEISVAIETLENKKSEIDNKFNELLAELKYFKENNNEDERKSLIAKYNSIDPYYYFENLFKELYYDNNYDLYLLLCNIINNTIQLNNFKDPKKNLTELLFNLEYSGKQKFSRTKLNQILSIILKLPQQKLSHLCFIAMANEQKFRSIIWHALNSNLNKNELVEFFSQDFKNYVNLHSNNDIHGEAMDSVVTKLRTINSYEYEYLFKYDDALDFRNNINEKIEQRIIELFKVHHIQSSSKIAELFRLVHNSTNVTKVINKVIDKIIAKAESARVEKNYINHDERQDYSYLLLAEAEEEIYNEIEKLYNEIFNFTDKAKSNIKYSIYEKLFELIIKIDFNKIEDMLDEPKNQKLLKMFKINPIKLSSNIEKVKQIYNNIDKINLVKDINTNKFIVDVLADVNILLTGKTIVKFINLKEEKIPELNKLNMNIGGYKFEVLDSSNKNAMEILSKVGEITDCCQRLGGAGEDAAIDSFINSHAGVVVLKDNQNRILTQSYFHYVFSDKENNRHGIILDNIEQSEKNVKENNLTPIDISKLYAEFAKQLTQKYPEIKYVRCGKNYTVGIDLSYFNSGSVEADKRRFHPKLRDKYTDYRKNDFINLLKPINSKKATNNIIGNYLICLANLI